MTSATTHEAQAGSANLASEQVRVWDIAVRVFHWSLVGAFAAAFLTADEWDRVHELAGYTALGLVTFRIVWGFVGTRHARFAAFVKGPGAVIAYLRDLLAGREKRHLGHNPAGAAMILVLLAGIIGLGVTGYMLTLEAYWSAQWVEDLHEAIANTMLVLVALHVAGVVLTGWRHGENLVAAMISGRKRAD